MRRVQEGGGVGEALEHRAVLLLLVLRGARELDGRNDRGHALGGRRAVGTLLLRERRERLASTLLELVPAAHLGEQRAHRRRMRLESRALRL